jgi:uncharacterized membrane protein YcfT
VARNGTGTDHDGTVTYNSSTATARVDWVDYAKGICIVMVVTMHSTLGIEAAVSRESFMHAVVAFAKPFRMPDFFLISGLFLAQVIDRDWRTYLDRKVVHFAYFYLLWVTLQFGFKAPAFALADGWPHVGVMYLESLIEPFGTLCFIYLLPIFFVVTKLTRGIPPVLIWAAAAALESLHIATGWTAIDQFAARLVYFYSGYLFADYIFALAHSARRHTGLTLIIVAAWALINAVTVQHGVSEWPLISIVLGFAGAAAVILIASLLAEVRWLNFLRYCGEHSIVIYLAFFLPMAATRTVLLKTGFVGDLGTMSVTVTACGVVGALALWWLVRDTPMKFLFERPDRFWLVAKKPRSRLQPAE